MSAFPQQFVVDQPRIAFAARAALARAQALATDSQRLCRSSAELRSQARRLRRGRGAPDPLVPEAEGFHLQGVVDGIRVTAEWTDGRVVGSEALLQRADLVVRLGETFGGADGAVVDAGLDGGPTRALLTCMRACDSIEGVSVRLSEPGEVSGSSLSRS